MEKVLVILPDNNKGKYIAKSYASAFKNFSFFVFERKLLDLSIDEVNNIKPNIIFTFWSDMENNDDLLDFFSTINFCLLKKSNRRSIPFLHTVEQ